MNIFKLINKADLIDKKASLIIEKLLREKENIDSESTTYYKVWCLLKELNSSINSPIFKFIKADNVPLSNDYITMIDSAATDINILSTECELLENSIYSAIKGMELTKQIFNNDIKYLNNALNNIIGNNLYFGKAIFEELFFKNSNEAKNETTAEVNTEEGYLSIKPKKYNNIKIKEINIDETSNGFPGNTHAADITDGEIKFLGETDLHKDLSSLFDNSMDTWFEYEGIKVDNKTIEKCNSYGFKYKEGNSWLINDDKLKLNIKINIENKINFLSLDPFVPENKDALPCIIENIQFYSGNDLIKEYNPNEYFLDKTVFIFEETYISYIKINFVQNKPYNTKIGHIYYIKTNSLKQSIFENDGDFERVEGILPSFNLLNPNTKYEKSYENLFYPINEKYDIKGSIEFLDAERFVIGIRNIEIANYEFAFEGEYISSTYNVESPVKSISLETKEFIPSEFDTFDEYIKYFISIDSGESWYPILPKHKAYLTNELDKDRYGGLNPYSVYIINDDDAFELRSAQVGYLNIPIDINSVKLKIWLGRPIDDKYKSMSPIIYSYKLNIETEGEFNEY